MTLDQYLYQRKVKIISDIKQDVEIKADTYHNVGLLKEIQGIIKITERNKDGR